MRATVAKWGENEAMTYHEEWVTNRTNNVCGHCGNDTLCSNAFTSDNTCWECSVTNLRDAEKNGGMISESMRDAIDSDKCHARIESAMVKAFFATLAKCR